MTTACRIPLFGALALAACAPSMKPGALSPVSARVTNAALEADQHTLDAWARRVASLGAAPAARVPERAYLAARAAAWIGFAREAYAADPRDSTADRALGETRRLVLALESTMPLPLERPAARPAGPRADLWAALDSLRRDGAAIVAPAALADAEVALVRAAYLSLAAPGTGSPLVRNAVNAERDCAIQLQLTRAEQLLLNLRGGNGRIASGPVRGTQAAPSAFSVQLAGAAAPAVAPDTQPPIQLVVHFAPASSALTPESRAALDEVIAGLRAQRSARISFDGYTGRRAGEKFDRLLATRRAEAVRSYLSEADLDLAQLTMASGRPAAGSSARDARMLLSFIGADGRSLTLTGVYEAEPKAEAPKKRRRAPVARHKQKTEQTTVAADRSPNHLR
jgi:outer membrane protein OmpA-like peptidoglycan-associated protein